MRSHMKLCCLYLTLVISLVLAIALPSIMAGAASTSAHQRGKTSVATSCQAGWVYDHITVIGTPLVRVGPAYQNINATNGPALSIFVEATSDTVVMTTSRSLTVSTLSF